MQSTIKDYAGEWLTSKQVADQIGMDPKYFSEKFIFKAPDFPRPYRSTDRGRRQWLRSDIHEWIQSRRVAA